MTAADRALHAVDEVRRTSAPSLQPLGVLVNRYRERSPEHRYRLQELGDMFGPLVLNPPMRERSALQQAQGASQPIHRWPGQPAAELAEAFDTHLNRVLRVRRKVKAAERVVEARSAQRQPRSARAAKGNQGRGDHAGCVRRDAGRSPRARQSAYTACMITAPSPAPA